MNLTIRWSPRSVRDINRHLDYLEENWDRNATNKVLDRIEEVLNIIATNPQLYPSFERNGNVYRCVITKQLVLYYRLEGNTIELITF